MLISLMFAFIACAAALCVFLLWHMTQRAEELGQVLVVQMKGFNETHMLGLEAVTMSLERLEKRVKDLEEEVL